MTDLEKMARAGYAKAIEIAGLERPEAADWGDLPDWERFVNLAFLRAALESIREPSEGMLEALSDQFAAESEIAISYHFTAGIDYILVEGEGDKKA